MIIVECMGVYEDNKKNHPSLEPIDGEVTMVCRCHYSADKATIFRMKSGSELLNLRANRAKECARVS